MSLQELENSVTSILLIEDSKAQALAIKSMLNGAPADTEIAFTLASGLLKLAEREFDIILLDLSLEDSYGLDTLVAVRNCAPQTAIVVLSAMDEVEEAIELGAQEYLLKEEVTPTLLRRAMARARVRLKAKSAESERLRIYEEREDFMATLTHDLKNPIIGSNRILELLIHQKLGALTEQQTEILSAVKGSNDILLEMICNFLDVYRNEKDMHDVSLEIIDMRALISKHVLGILPLAADRGITITVDIIQEEVPIHADRCSITRVLDNLIGNAIKFVPDGGTIMVKLAKQDRKEALLQVSDSGPGIPKEEQHYLFQRFWRSRKTRASNSGTGLGLYLCHQIIEAHRGTISCEADESRGTTFSVRLPLAA
ncbi:MAG: hybrid sensor histidine kinase/response regulator [Candidatus Obscuribacterales bacterium]|nr:hybrid sensor histidine kinase/response regulator [Candidatus Obscuribacterales bacterium]